MFELLKLAWDAIVLRDSIKKGEMTGNVWGAALLLLLALTCIAVPSVIYFDRHPDAPASALIYPGVGVVLWMVAFIWFSVRRQKRLNRERSTNSETQGPRQ